jgi:hypothetical protein
VSNSLGVGRCVSVLFSVLFFTHNMLLWRTSKAP